MTRFAISMTAVLLAAVPALAQQSIRWTTDVPAAIEAAQKNKAPLMFYVKGSSGGDDDVEDYEREHKHAFADPRVVELAQNFVCVQMSRSRYRDQLEAWKLSPRTNLEMVFTKPDGTLISTLSAAGIATKASLAQKMSLVLQAHREEYFRSEIEPVLTDESADIKDIQAALRQVADMRIKSADNLVIGILGREKLDARTYKAALDALAALSTKPAVDKLFELALQDPKLEKVLQECTPAGAEFLLDYIGGEDFDKHLVAYHAVTKICKVSRPKNDRFWSGPNERIKVEENERVREAVKKAAERWKAEHD